MDKQRTVSDLGWADAELLQYTREWDQRGLRICIRLADSRRVEVEFEYAVTVREYFSGDAWEMNLISDFVHCPVLSNALESDIESYRENFPAGSFLEFAGYQILVGEAVWIEIGASAKYHTRFLYD